MFKAVYTFILLFSNLVLHHTYPSSYSRSQSLRDVGSDRDYSSSFGRSVSMPDLSRASTPLSRDPELLRLFDAFARTRENQHKEIELWERIYLRIEQLLRQDRLSSNEIFDRSAQFISSKLTGIKRDRALREIGRVRKLTNGFAVSNMLDSLAFSRNSRMIGNRKKWLGDWLNAIYDRVLGKEGVFQAPLPSQRSRTGLYDTPDEYFSNPGNDMWEYRR